MVDDGAASLAIFLVEDGGTAEEVEDDAGYIGMIVSAVDVDMVDARALCAVGAGGVVSLSLSLEVRSSCLSLDDRRILRDLLPFPLLVCPS